MVDESHGYILPEPVKKAVSQILKELYSPDGELNRDAQIALQEVLAPIFNLSTGVVANLDLPQMSESEKHQQNLLDVAESIVPPIPDRADQLNQRWSLVTLEQEIIDILEQNEEYRVNKFSSLLERVTTFSQQFKQFTKAISVKIESIINTNDTIAKAKYHNFINFVYSGHGNTFDAAITRYFSNLIGYDFSLFVFGDTINNYLKSRNHFKMIHDYRSSSDIFDFIKFDEAFGVLESMFDGNLEDITESVLTSNKYESSPQTDHNLDTRFQKMLNNLLKKTNIEHTYFKYHIDPPNIKYSEIRQKHCLRQYQEVNSLNSRLAGARAEKVTKLLENMGSIKPNHKITSSFYFESNELDTRIGYLAQESVIEASLSRFKTKLYKIFGEDNINKSTGILFLNKLAQKDNVESIGEVVNKIRAVFVTLQAKDKNYDQIKDDLEIVIKEINNIRYNNGIGGRLKDFNNSIKGLAEFELIRIVADIDVLLSARKHGKLLDDRFFVQLKMPDTLKQDGEFITFDQLIAFQLGRNDWK